LDTDIILSIALSNFSNSSEGLEVIDVPSFHFFQKEGTQRPVVAHENVEVRQ
jgi:hypothetical protein